MNIKEINDALLNILWGKPMLFLIMGTGIFLSLRTRFFHIRYAKHIFIKTFLSLFKKKEKISDKNKITPLQSLSCALASTLGTGNITGVAAAIAVGGAGTIFWMWLSAIFGMITKYAEYVLSVHFRQKNGGGDMYYLKYGLQKNCLLSPLAKPLSCAFSLFCLLASFGVGNMVQINSVSNMLESVWHIPHLYTGIFVSVLVLIIILKGTSSIVKVTERLIPFMSVLYTGACLVVIILHLPHLPVVFKTIFEEAFGIRAVAGFSLFEIITLGFKRGIFSNEAGLGASTIVHGQADAKSPAEQGMWGIFEVFFDTIVSCTLTAFAILSSQRVLSGDTISLLTGTFSSVFGKYSGAFLAVVMSLFAFSTIIGWSFYGIKSAQFLWHGKYVTLYKIIYALLIIPGATQSLTLVWEISDSLNALMAIPNLLGVLALSGTVSKITDKYIKEM